MTNEKGALVGGTTRANASSTGNQTETERNPIIHPIVPAVKDYGPAGQIILPHLRSGQGNARKKPERLEQEHVPRNGR